MRGHKVIDCSFHYVCREFAVARNGLNLLGKMDGRNPFHLQMQIRAMDRSHLNIFSNVISKFHIYQMFTKLDKATGGLALRELRGIGNQNAL